MLSDIGQAMTHLPNRFSETAENPPFVRPCSWKFNLIFVFDEFFRNKI